MQADGCWGVALAYIQMVEVFHVLLSIKLTRPSSVMALVCEPWSVMTGYQQWGQINNDAIKSLTNKIKKYNNYAFII